MTASQPLPAKGANGQWIRALLTAILPGLAVAQCWATLHVYLSNTALYRSLAALESAGFFIIPNSPVMQTLPSFKAAFFGGLFFTLSIGSGLSILTLIFMILWDRLLTRRHLFLAFLGMVWCAGLFFLNRNGILPVETAYFLIVPVVTGGIYTKHPPSPDRHHLWSELGFLFIPLVLLSIIWATQFHGDIFVTIRDHLLLGNPVGRKINDFYYRYTLYPAQAFKSINKKTLKTADLSEIPPSSTKRRIEILLRSRDYLDLPGYPEADLKIHEEEGRLLFRNVNKTILAVAPDIFIANPSDSLAQYSANTDRYGFFRIACFFGLLLGFPIFLYLLLYGLVYALIRCFAVPRTAGLWTAGICLLAGTVILWPVYRAKSNTVDKNRLYAAMASERWELRTAAVKYIYNEGMEISKFTGYKKMVKSPHIPERYWLARALGQSRKKETYSDLVEMLQDRQPNVLCQIYYALGQRGNSGAIDLIKEKMAHSDHWYEQWYGYRAMRRLGWTQKKSD